MSCLLTTDAAFIAHVLYCCLITIIDEVHVGYDAGGATLIFETELMGINGETTA